MSDTETLKTGEVIHFNKRRIINPKNPPIPMPSPVELNRINYEMTTRANQRSIDRFIKDSLEAKRKPTPNPKFFRALWNLCVISLKVMVKLIRSKFSPKR